MPEDDFEAYWEALGHTKPPPLKVEDVMERVRQTAAVIQSTPLGRPRITKQAVLDLLNQMRVQDARYVAWSTLNRVMEEIETRFEDEPVLQLRPDWILVTPPPIEIVCRGSYGNDGCGWQGRVVDLYEGCCPMCGGGHMARV